MSAGAYTTDRDGDTDGWKRKESESERKREIKRSNKKGDRCLIKTESKGRKKDDAR